LNNLLENLQEVLRKKKKEDYKTRAFRSMRILEWSPLMYRWEMMMWQAAQQWRLAESHGSLCR
jgi:hypothetical protein